MRLPGARPPGRHEPMRRAIDRGGQRERAGAGPRARMPSAAKNEGHRGCGHARTGPWIRSAGSVRGRARQRGGLRRTTRRKLRPDTLRSVALRLGRRARQDPSGQGCGLAPRRRSPGEVLRRGARLPRPVRRAPTGDPAGGGQGRGRCSCRRRRHAARLRNWRRRRRCTGQRRVTTRGGLGQPGHGRSHWREDGRRRGAGSARAGCTQAPPTGG